MLLVGAGSQGSALVPELWQCHRRAFWQDLDMVHSALEQGRQLPRWCVQTPGVQPLR